MLGMSFSCCSDQELLNGNSCTESSVDDLGTCRGVVLSRAATILRSIETQPPTGRFVHHKGMDVKTIYLDRKRLRETKLLLKIVKIQFYYALNMQ